MSDVQGTLEIQVPDAAGAMRVPVKDFDRATPALLCAYLQTQQKLPVEDPDRPYFMTHGSQRLIPTAPLSAQGVRPNSTILVERHTTGATLGG